MAELWYPKDHPWHASLQACAARQSAVAMLKLEAGCADCSYNKDPVALDFDHVRGEKVANIRKLTQSASMERILEEIEKCEVVCSNCHRIRTVERSRLRV